MTDGPDEGRGLVAHDLQVSFGRPKQRPRRDSPLGSPLNFRSVLYCELYVQLAAKELGQHVVRIQNQVVVVTGEGGQLGHDHIRIGGEAGQEPPG